ncbi:hypothetical protein EZS27_014050 [termite gut metagenome]|uniref:DUF4843 domain-containing protein n=1 Tax=termite gut metagenome TaxID=433724 RepID=A0A5J4RW04_9ZZZZ
MKYTNKNAMVFNIKTWIKTGIIMGAIFVCASCKEDEIEVYSGPAAIDLSIAGTSDWSFMINVAESEYIFNINLSAVGYLENKDRIVKFFVGERSTAPSTSYEIPSSVTIRAGESKGTTTLKVKKAGLGETDIYSLVLKIDPSGDFTGGIRDSVAVSFTRDFPKSWYSSDGQSDGGAAGYYLGKCTHAKYQVVFDFLGNIDLIDYSGWFDGSASNLAIALNNAVAAYNSLHPDNPKKDDDGSDLVFSPST